MPEDEGEQLSIGIDDGAVDGTAEIGSVGLLEHGCLFELHFAASFAQRLQMVAGVAVYETVILLLEDALEDS
jgi:hypothetical protein